MWGGGGGVNIGIYLLLFHTCSYTNFSLLLNNLGNMDDSEISLPGEYADEKSPLEENSANEIEN